MKAALAYELLEEYKSAVSCYDKIIKNYVNASEYQTARKEKARLEALVNAG